MSLVPAWSVMPYPHPPRQRSCHGGCYPAPLLSTPSASSRETRRHFVPSRSLLGRSRRSAPPASRRSAARRRMRGRWCHRSGPGTALRCRPPVCKRPPQSLRAWSSRQEGLRPPASHRTGLVGHTSGSSERYPKASSHCCPSEAGCVGRMGWRFCHKSQTDTSRSANQAFG